MAQMTVRQIDDQRYEQLKARAKLRGTSAEALAREAIHDAAPLTVEEKLAIVREMRAWSRTAQIPGMPQSLGVDLIREGREE
jgi:plasmid stability protein